MSFFECRKVEEIDPALKVLSRPRETLDGLESERDETPQIAELRRIPAGRICRIEAQNGVESDGLARILASFLPVECPIC